MRLAIIAVLLGLSSTAHAEEWWVVAEDGAYLTMADKDSIQSVSGAVQVQERLSSLRMRQGGVAYSVIEKKYNCLDPSMSVASISKQYFSGIVDASGPLPEKWVKVEANSMGDLMLQFVCAQPQDGQVRVGSMKDASEYTEAFFAETIPAPL